MALYQRLLAFMNVTKDDCVTLCIQRYAIRISAAPKRLSAIPLICVSELAYNFSNSRRRLFAIINATSIPRQYERLQPFYYGT